MNFREQAASFVLCNDNVKEALELLDNATDNIPDEVMIWEKFEYDTLETIIGYIDTIESMLKEAFNQGKNHK